MNLLFFASATGEYNDFVLPFLTSALIHNPGSGCEILTDNPELFQESGNRIRELYGGQVLIRAIPARYDSWKNAPHLAGAIRFVIIPKLEANYTYIGDIDILTLDAVGKAHIPRLEERMMAYDNIIRPGTKRLTGLHFVKSYSWYSRLLPSYLESVSAWYEQSDLNSDEGLLYVITEEKFMMVSPEEDYRPVHGIHISPNRTIDGDPGWGVSKTRAEQFLEMMEHPEWKLMSPYFTDRFNGLQDQITNYAKRIL